MPEVPDPRGWPFLLQPYGVPYTPLGELGGLLATRPAWATPSALLGPVEAPEPFVAPTPETVAQDPGYQWRLQEGLRALEASAAARGLLRTGPTLQAITQWAQGLAAQELENAFQRALQAYQARLQQAQFVGGERQRAFERAVQDYQTALSGWLAGAQTAQDLERLRQAAWQLEWQRFLRDREHAENVWRTVYQGGIQAAIAGAGRHTDGETGGGGHGDHADGPHADQHQDGGPGHEDAGYADVGGYIDYGPPHLDELPALGSPWPRPPAFRPIRWFR